MKHINITLPDKLHKTLKLNAIKNEITLKKHILDKLELYFCNK
jgi:hypothetical protein